MLLLWKGRWKIRRNSSPISYESCIKNLKINQIKQKDLSAEKFVSVCPQWPICQKRLLLFTHSVMSDVLWPHGLQHTRPPDPLPSPRPCRDSSPLSWWCHQTISSSVFPFSFCLQSFPASGSFQMSESTLHMRWPKYWSFSFSISHSNEYSGLISFRMDSLDLLAVQGTLKSLLQHHSSKASVLLCSTFLMVQLSHPKMTTGKTIALTICTFVDRVSAF